MKPLQCIISSSMTYCAGCQTSKRHICPKMGTLSLFNSMLLGTISVLHPVSRPCLAHLKQTPLCCPKTHTLLLIHHSPKKLYLFRVRLWMKGCDKGECVTKKVAMDGPWSYTSSFSHVPLILIILCICTLFLPWEGRQLHSCTDGQLIDVER